MMSCQKPFTLLWPLRVGVIAGFFLLWKTFQVVRVCPTIFTLFRLCLMRPYLKEGQYSFTVPIPHQLPLVILLVGWVHLAPPEIAVLVPQVRIFIFFHPQLVHIKYLFKYFIIILGSYTPVFNLRECILCPNGYYSTEYSVSQYLFYLFNILIASLWLPLTHIKILVLYVIF